MLRAAYELTRQRTRLNILINGQPAQPRDGAIRLAPDYGQLNAGITLLNKGDALVWRTTSVQGTPSAPLPAFANGVQLTKSVWTISGSPADLANLHQNDRVIVELSGRLGNEWARQMGVIDLLPAGLEIEQTLSGDDGKPYAFLGALTNMSMADKRDDRYVGAFTIGSGYRLYDPKRAIAQPDFHVAYIARAVTVGTYVMPAGVAEDMYAPQILARTTLGQVTVKP
jgi:hypothetical protein